MRVLFVIAQIFFSEPLGAMILSGVCRAHGHRTRLAILSRGGLQNILDDFDPDVVAYSTMTSDEPLFAAADQTILKWGQSRDRRIWRIMGGPHPTFFPQVLTNLQLDAICSGDGERAILRVLDAIAEGRGLDGIPNISTTDHPDFVKEIVEDMDGTAFADRDLIYDAAPDMLEHGIRSFLTQKGCPYKCTSCFNHAYNRRFKGDGRKIIRRRSVSNLIAEIKDVVARYPTTTFIRFADDVFVIRRDAWLDEFADRYPREVGIPFYCLIRGNILTEDVASLLSKAGCRSIGMSIESGSATVRNEIMKRNMPDAMLRNAFELSRRYGLNAIANTILCVPGTTFEDDLRSFRFSRELAPACPSFSVFSPYPGTDLTRYAIELGQLPADFDFNDHYGIDQSVLSGYSDLEQMMLTRLVHLAPLFCKLPDFMQPMLTILLRIPLTGPYRVASALVMSYVLGTRIFPNAHPRGLVPLARALWQAVRHMASSKRRPRRKGMAGG